MHVEGPGLCLPDNGAFVLLLTQGFLPAAGHGGSPVTFRWGTGTAGDRLYRQPALQEPASPQRLPGDGGGCPALSRTG